MTEPMNPTPPAQATAPKPPETREPPLRGRELRRALLSKLPRLAVSRGADEDLIDVEEEMRAAMELDADGVLEPLEALLERGRS